MANRNVELDNCNHALLKLIPHSVSGDTELTRYASP